MSVAVLEFLAQPPEDGFEHRLRPTPVVQLVRSSGIGRQELVSRFRVLGELQREELLAIATFLTVHPIPFVSQIVLQGREQKSPEPATFAIGCPNQTFIQEPLEQTLGEILSILLGITLPADEVVER